MPGNPDPSNDPLDLDAVDREIRMNELEERAKELGMESLGAGEDCPPGIHTEFLRDVLDYDSAPIGTQFHRLLQSGVTLPEPDSLDDAALHAKLWEVIEALAKMDTFLCRTDHLSDRGLYEQLWSDVLLEETALMPSGSGWVHHLDMIGGCSEEDIQISLRYYDDEDGREQWAKDFPSDVIPPHEDPPFDRDRLLPRPPLDMPGLPESDLDDEPDEE